MLLPAVQEPATQDQLPPLIPCLLHVVLRRLLSYAVLPPLLLFCSAHVLHLRSSGHKGQQHVTPCMHVHFICLQDRTEPSPLVSISIPVA
jgi:hypothetical protein